MAGWPKEKCKRCGASRWGIGKWINAGGHITHPYFCHSCGKRLDRYASKLEAAGFAVTELGASENIRKCVKCGVLGAEEHHWAPAEMFEDSGQWPTSYLCQKCHNKWHMTIEEFYKVKVLDAQWRKTT